MLSVLPQYLAWHYQRGIKDVHAFSNNILWFFWNFFSIGLLLQTLFSPWQKLEEHGTKGDIASYFSAFIITTLMRLVGALLRLIFITIGLTVFLAVFVLFLILEILWFVMPFFLGAVFILGLVFIFKSI